VTLKVSLDFKTPFISLDQNLIYKSHIYRKSKSIILGLKYIKPNKSLVMTVKDAKLLNKLEDTYLCF